MDETKHQAAKPHDALPCLRRLLLRNTPTKRKRFVHEGVRWYAVVSRFALQIRRKRRPTSFGYQVSFVHSLMAFNEKRFAQRANLYRNYVHFLIVIFINIAIKPLSGLRKMQQPLFH